MYFVSTFHSIKRDPRNKSSFMSSISSLRTVGYFEDFNDAERIVVENVCDIWEYTYDYAMIEEIGPGLYPTIDGFWLYKWNTEAKKYERIALPEGFSTPLLSSHLG